MIAFVLPYTFTQGAAWSKARNLLNTYYKDIHIITIAGAKDKSRAFSADTGLAECLVIATKKHIDDNSLLSTKITTLTNRPKSLLEASIQANQDFGISFKNQDRFLSAGIASGIVISACAGLTDCTLLLPRTSNKWKISIVSLGEIAERGVYHTKFMANYGGAFDKKDLIKEHIPAYPMLWGHDADTQKRFVLKPDSHAEIVEKKRDKAIQLWQETASRLHFNRDFRINSQCLTACLTSNKTLGGHAWPNVVPYNPDYEIPLLLWANSTLGTILFWWHGSRQTSGRTSVTIAEQPGLPVLDV